MIAEQVRELVKQVKGYGDISITPDTRLIDDLSFDSMDVMNLILEIEKYYSIRLRDADLDLDHFVTFGRVLLTLNNYDVGAR